VAGCFDDFPGLRNYRADEDGAEWVRKSEQARTRIRRDPFDWKYESLPGKQIFLRVWSPDLARTTAGDGTLCATIEKLSGSTDADADPVSLQPGILHEQNYDFGPPVSFSQSSFNGHFSESLVPRLQRERPHPGPLPQERGNNPPMVGYNERSHRFMDSSRDSAIAEAPYERIYSCPTNLSLEPFSAYRIAGWVQGEGKSMARFEFTFNTDGEGRPTAY
jgi:hypothetical protein